MHFVVFGGIEQAQVQLSLVSYRFAHCRDLLLNHIQRGVHGVMKFQLILNGHAANVQRIVLQSTDTHYKYVRDLLFDNLEKKQTWQTEKTARVHQC